MAREVWTVEVRYCVTQTLHVSAESGREARAEAMALLDAGAQLSVADWTSRPRALKIDRVSRGVAPDTASRNLARSRAHRRRVRPEE